MAGKYTHDPHNHWQVYLIRPEQHGPTGRWATIPPGLCTYLDGVTKTFGTWHQAIEHIRERHFKHELRKYSPLVRNPISVLRPIPFGRDWVDEL